jgi:hypothetical protein
VAFTNLPELTQRVRELIQNERAGRGLPALDVDAVVTTAVAWLSRFAPRRRTATLSGTGSAFQFAVPAGWVAGFSSFLWVEYPVNEQVRSFIDAGEWEYFPDRATATHLHLAVTPELGTDNIRVSYTTPHTVDASTSTVPDDLEPGFEYGAACAVCRAYAARYGHTTDPGIDADSVDYRGKGREWSDLAKQFCAAASTVFGVNIGEAPETEGAIAGGFHEWDVTPHPYRSLLFRTKTQR